MKLTDTRIRSLKALAAPRKISDGKGLYLEVRKAAGDGHASKLWRYRYRLSGRENIFAIGSYPEMTLAQARDARVKAAALVKTGVHPSHHRKAERVKAELAQANTLEAVGNEWLAANKPHWTYRTHRQRQLLLERNVYPAVLPDGRKAGAVPLKDLVSADVHQVLRSIKAPQMAVLARQALSGTLQFGISTGRAEIDVTYPLRKTVRTAPTRHKQPLRQHEIPPFFEALERYTGGPLIKAAIRLLWWTLARPTEVIGARWEEFHLEHATWTIPASRMKMRQPHAVPLPTQAVELLKAIRPLTINTGCVLPNRSDPRRPASLGIINKAIVSMGYDGKFSAHGVRVTGRTILGEQGHPRDVLERQLAHRDKKEVRAYDQGDRLEARRVVMQGWADFLDGMRAREKVTSIRRRRL